MIPATLSIAAILGSLLILLDLLGSRRAQVRFAPEIRRKFLHIAMGSITLTLPFIFDNSMHVWWLAGLATGAFLTIRSIRWLKARIGGAIHAINRESFGELCFPLGVATLFSLAEGSYLHYLVPMLILTFGDSLAALIGIYRGRLRYPTLDGSKSLEGSLVMFIVSLLCVLLPFGFAGTIEGGSLILVGLNLALLITLIEALAWRGIDNFLIPVAGFYLIDAYLPLQTANLLPQAMLNGALVLAFMLLNQQRLQEE